jgi:signal transduction histidine kinase
MIVRSVFNLIGNSLKYTLKGESAVYVWSSSKASTKYLACHLGSIAVSLKLVFLSPSIVQATDTISSRLSPRFFDEYAEFLVQDTGIGIPIADQPLVVERFHRVASVGRSHEGAGIGLSLTFDLIKVRCCIFSLLFAAESGSSNCTPGPQRTARARVSQSVKVFIPPHHQAPTSPFFPLL